ERAGLIERGREAQWRPCRIAPGGLKGVDEWLERYREFWDERFDRLGGYLRDVRAKQKKGKRHGRHDRRCEDAGRSRDRHIAPDRCAAGARIRRLDRS